MYLMISHFIHENIRHNILVLQSSSHYLWRHPPDGEAGGDGGELLHRGVQRAGQTEVSNLTQPNTILTVTDFCHFLQMENGGIILFLNVV